MRGLNVILEISSIIERPPFSRDLSLNSRGEDVAALQTFLGNGGYYPEALVTGYFGPLTQAALARFQKANAIQPASGYLGPVTRHKIEDMMVGAIN